MKFARAVKKYRKDQGLTQQKFAEEVGVCKTSVSLWENGWAIPQHRAVRRRLLEILGEAVEELL